MPGHEQGRDIQGHDIVVVGFSAGGIQPLIRLVRDLPSDFPASLFVVHHFPPQSVSALPGIIRRAARLPVATPGGPRFDRAGASTWAGPIATCSSCQDTSASPQDRASTGTVRPSIPSFARQPTATARGSSASSCPAPSTTAPRDFAPSNRPAAWRSCRTRSAREYPGMPRNAIEHVDIDHVMPPEEIGSLLSRLVCQPAPTPPASLRSVEETVEGGSAEKTPGRPDEGEHRGTEGANARLASASPRPEARTVMVMSLATRRPQASRVIAISASAGGLAALIAVLAELSPTLAASVLVVQHLAPTMSVIWSRFWAGIPVSRSCRRSRPP